MTSITCIIVPTLCPVTINPVSLITCKIALYNCFVIFVAISAALLKRYPLGKDILMFVRRFTPINKRHTSDFVKNRLHFLPCDMVT